MADRIIFVCILVLGGVYFWATSKIPTLEIGDPLGPKAFPQLLGIGLLLSAVMLFFEILKERKTPAAPKAPSSDDTSKRQYLTIAGAVVVTLVCFMLFEPLGYIVSTALYLLIMTSYFNRGRWLMNVLTSLLYSVISYVMFVKMLGVNLPKGIIPF